MKASPRSLFALVLLVLAVSLASQWWAGRQEQSMGRQVAALAQPGDIRMLSSETCVFCTAARRWMTEHRVRFEECFIERDAQCKALYDTTLARGTPTLIVRGQVQLGFNASNILAALQARG